MKITLTEAEIEALYATSGNIDPCMFDDMDGKEGERMFVAWTSGLKKLSDALDTLSARKIVAHGAAVECDHSDYEEIHDPRKPFGFEALRCKKCGHKFYNPRGEAV